MGLTHNWKRETELPADAFARAVEDCRKVVAATGVPVGGFDGSGKPIFDRDKIVFNGAARGRCEPFEIHQTQFDRRGWQSFWSFCKTQHAAYDICVKTSLIAFKHHLGSAFKVTSDDKDDEWNDARAICQQTLGYGADFKLDAPELA